MMRITDWFLVMPTLVLAIALATVMSRSLGTIILAIGVTTWPTTARLVRAQTLAVESRPYIERARALGGGHWHVMSRHVLPNVMPLVLAQTTLIISTAILTEATLAFLGLGDPTVVSWGGLLQDAREAGAVSAGQLVVSGAAGYRDRRGRARVHAVRARGRSPSSTPSWGWPRDSSALLDVRNLEVTYAGGARRRTRCGPRARRGPEARHRGRVGLRQVHARARAAAAAAGRHAGRPGRSCWTARTC